MTEHTHHHEKLNTATGTGFEPVTIHPDCMIGNDTSPRAHAYTVGVNEQNPTPVTTYGPHHPYPDNYVQGREPVHPQWLPESSAPYIQQEGPVQVGQACGSLAMTIPFRIDRILDRIALYEAKLGI